MILKFGMTHQAMELYKVYINCDPWMTHAFVLGKLLKCHLKGETCSKLANGLEFNDLKKRLTPGVALIRPWGYIHVYYHCSQTSLLVCISGFR